MTELGKVRIHLGYEVPTGEPISIPLHHVAITGLTRLAGKTTAIEGLLARLPKGMTALLFRTKRGELSFAGSHQAEPFYRQQTDWEYVESLLEAAMKERMRLERSFIIKATKGTRTLRQVYNNIVRLHGEARRGFDESIWTNLQAYFDKVLPQLEANPFAQKLALQLGPNVMDLGQFSEEVQALVISACLEEVWKTRNNTVVVVPEAWKFMPQQRGNPVKWAAQHVIREGGAVGVYLYLDSQDITGVTKDVLKSVDVWLLGRQREKNEVDRVLAQLPTSTRPKAEEIMTLPLGHFYVAAESWCKKVYVQPTWLSNDTAQSVATGKVDVATLRIPENLPEEDPMVIADLEAQVSALEKRISEVEANNDILLQQLETRTTEKTALEARRDALFREIEGLSEKTLATEKLLLERLAPLRNLQKALQAVLVPLQAELDSKDGSMEEIADMVLAKIGTSRVIQVTPLEGLKHQYQQQAVDRMVATISALAPRPREALQWLVAIDKPVPAREICQRLGFPKAGDSFVKFTQGLNALVGQGVLTKDSHGLKASVREKVQQELQVYEASPEDMEASYQALISALGMK